MLYDYYKILEIPRTATTAEVKRAYRNKAKTVHPDINHDPKANEIFAIIHEAYEVLIDTKKRYLHDIKLEYIDKLKAESLSRKHYYGASIKSNPVNGTDFNPNLNSYKTAWKEKTDAEAYKESPLLYNLFFASGMFVGFLIIFVVVLGIYKNVWQFWTAIIAVPGIILVKEGWKGISGKNTSLISWIRRFKNKPH